MSPGHHCPECAYKAKSSGTLKTHAALKHDLGVKWWFCYKGSCDYKAKLNTSIIKLKANVHDIGVVWKHHKCEYKTKQQGHLTNHYDRHHNSD